MTHEKSEVSINNLAQDTQSEINDYIKDEPSRSSLFLTSRMFGFGAFQDQRIKAKLLHYMAAGKFEMLSKLLAIRPDLRSEIKPLVQQALFKLAGFGEQDKMDILLKIYPEFLYTYAPLKDISNVYPIINKEGCKGITVFQHALWAGDVRYMCNMMLDCLPTNENGEKIKIELLRQYKELMEHGVVYKRDGKSHHEIQFSLQPLLDGLTQYVTDYKKRTAPQLESHWCTHVGLPQSHLPAHYRHHYCDPEQTFSDEPNFTKMKLTRSLKFYNYFDNKKKLQLWDDSLTGLGLNFGITGSGMPVRCQPAVREGGQRSVWKMFAETDLRSLTALREARTNIDHPALMKRLQSDAKPEEEHGALCVIVNGQI